MKLAAILASYLILAASCQAAWANMPNSPSSKIQYVLIDASGCIWITEANNNTNSGGAWKSDHCGTAITDNETFTIQTTGTPTVGQMALNASNQVVAEAHNLTSGPIYLGDANPMTTHGTATDFVTLAKDPSAATLWAGTHACAATGQNHGLWRSADGGSSWTVRTTGGNQSSGICNAVTVHPTNSNVYMNTESQGIWEWNDAGSGSWVSGAATVTTQTFCATYMWFMPNTANTLWANDCNGNMHKCDLTASDKSTSCPSVTVEVGFTVRVKGLVAVGSGCATSPFTTNCTWYAVGVRYTSTGPRAYSSTDLGATWSTFQTGLPTPASGSDGTVVAYDSFDGYLYMGADGTNGGLYRQLVGTPQGSGGSAMSGNAAMGGNAVMR